MKHLALGFCSLRPIQLSDEVNDARENEYFICIQQLKRVLPESFDLLICENTINDPEEIRNNDLRKLLSESEMCVTGNVGNIGTKNKGMGELLMLKTALMETDIDSYKNISYITSRRFFTCPYVFDKTERLEKSALLSNPDFAFLNGKFIETNKYGAYNDMFFSMNASVMLNYANYAFKHIESDHSQLLGSEQILYNFIEDNNIDYEWLNWLGIVRNDWERNNKILDVNNLHIC